MPSLTLQTDVLLRLRRQEPLVSCRQRLEPESIDMAMEPSHGGLDALEPPGERMDLPADEGTPRQVQGELEDGIVQGKAPGAYRRRGVPRWPWWPSYTSRVMTNSSR